MAKQQRPLSTPTRMTPEDVANHLAALQAKQIATPLLPSNRFPARRGNKAARILILTFLVFCVIIGGALASRILFDLTSVGQYIALIPIMFSILVGFIFITKRYSWTGFQKKTLWDWLEVTLIPILFLIITISATNQQTATMQQQNTIADEQRKSEILQNYTSTIQDLILHEGLHQSKPGENVRVIATTQTTLALKQLDGERKGSLLLFIYQLGLIDKSKAIIDLRGADLFEVNIVEADLRGADLRGANFSYANLVDADLRGADLRGALLMQAYLFGADLHGADLRGANFNGADLTGGDLRGANLNDAYITRTILSKTLLPNGSRHP